MVGIQIYRQNRSMTTCHSVTVRTPDYLSCYGNGAMGIVRLKNIMAQSRKTWDPSSTQRASFQVASVLKLHTRNQHDMKHFVQMNSSIFERATIETIIFVQFISTICFYRFMKKFYSSHSIRSIISTKTAH